MSRAIIILFLFLNANYCFAQQESVKNTSLPGNATNLYAEKVLVHSDKQFYITGEIIWFKIYVTDAASNLPLPLSKTAYTELIDQNGNILSQAKIELTNGTGSGSFELPLNANSGNYHLSVYTNWMRNNPSSIFNKNITVINTQHSFDTTAFMVLKEKNEEADARILTDNRPANLKNKKLPPFNIQVITNQKVYQKRSAVEIIFTPKSDAAITTNLSVAVYKLNDLDNGGEFGEEEAHSENTNSSLKMITDHPAFIPEMNGYLVHVKVKNTETGKPMPGIPVILSLTGKLANFQYGESDEEGIAYFNLKNVYGPQQFLVKTTPEFENTVDLELVKSFLKFPVAPIVEKVKIKNEYLAAVEEMHNNLVINKAFTPDISDYFYATNLDSLSFFGVPTSTYLLDNYKRFITMEEVLREYVKEVMVRIRNKNYYLLVFNKQLFYLRKYVDVTNNMMDENGPLVLLDGIPVTDLNKLMKYDPLKIRKLQLVAERYLIGQNVYDGILSFTTYKGEFEDLQLNKKELLFEDDGWQLKRKFYMPDYSNPLIKNNRIPDFRQLLFWAPEVKTSKSENGKITFYTGDLTGKFAVEVKGISADGRIVNEMNTFEVKK